MAWLHVMYASDGWQAPPRILCSWQHLSLVACLPALLTETALMQQILKLGTWLLSVLPY